MAAQALVTSTIMQTIMGVVGAGVSIAGGVSGAADVGAGTAIQNAGNNLTFKYRVMPKAVSSGFSFIKCLQQTKCPRLSAVLRFRKKAGVFGEAGPEAIMPLTRAGDGSLGVRAVGGSERRRVGRAKSLYHD